MMMVILMMIMVGDDNDDVDDGWRWSPRVRSCWLGGVASLPTPCPEHSPSKKEDKMVILLLRYMMVVLMLRYMMVVLKLQDD